MKLIFLILCIYSVGTFANSKNIALVKVLRGEASYTLENNQKVILSKGDWIKEGAIVHTEVKSFVRLKFIDESKVNIGPSSQVKVERFSNDSPGVLSVVTGKIRAEVSKDYLKMKKNKSKLFVRSNDAVMGIRGTDFLFSSNKKSGNTTAILFEGSVVFNKLPSGAKPSSYEKIVNNGKLIKPGEFSVINRNSSSPSSPTKLNKKQFNHLYRNKQFQKKKSNKILVPRGLKKSLVKVSDESKSPVLHLGSGSIISSNIELGNINKSGEFEPPTGIVIEDSGEVFQKEGGKLKKLDKSSDGKIALEADTVDLQNQDSIKLVPRPVDESFVPETFRRSSPSSLRRPVTRKRFRVIINTGPEGTTGG